MPLAVDYEPISSRPTKRRRFQEDHKMARVVEVEDEAPPLWESHSQDRLEAGCEVQTTMDQPLPETQTEIQTSDRDELIRYIKRGQRPMWVPKPGLQALYAEEEALQERRNVQNDTEFSPSHNVASYFDDDLLFGSWTTGSEAAERPRTPTHAETLIEEDLAVSGRSPVERQGTDYLGDEPSYPIRQSPPSWLESPSYSLIGRAVSGMRDPQDMASARTGRSRAPSLSSSFVMRVPTSPLVHAVNNPNLDFSPRNDTASLDAGDKKGRRRTMPPHSFQSYTGSSVDPSTPNFSRPLPLAPLRRESTFPHQTHQSRRSLGSFTLQPGLTLQNSRSSSRRFSITDAPLPRRTSMIGSFEESILRGRMSSPASKPFDFVAQIGVMGKGDCPASLKCPGHVSVPFQAVFYSYPSSQALRSIADDTPSPYVGTVDLEHNLKPVQLATKRKRASTVSGRSYSEVETDLPLDTSFTSSDPRAPENTPIGKALARDVQLQQQSAKPAERLNLGGAYRVPQQGQLQVVIKNSNNIAVKLFLIPYDLADMEPGTKTFIRQRSYTSGPIVETALTDKDRQPHIQDPLKDKNILRYLIHLRFCCPSKGKFYLYDNIRVVFANRVPDGKEKLRNEVQLPEPRYSPWKALKTSQRSASHSTVDLSPISAHVRQASSPGNFDDMRTTRVRDQESIPEEVPGISDTQIPFRGGSMSARRSSPPGNLVSSKTLFKFPTLSGTDDSPRQPERALSQVSGFFASTSPRSSPVPWGETSVSPKRSFSPTPIEAGTGLLSKQFRQLRSSSIYSEAELHSGPWAATASLTRILSETESPPSETRDEDS